MNSKAAKILIAFVVLVGLTAALLARLRSSYELGKPGVKVANIPIYGETNNVVSDISVPLPEDILGCSSVQLPVANIELSVLPPDTVYGRRSYKSEDGFQTLLQVVLMGSDRTSIHKPQYCLTGQGWTIEHSEVITIPIFRPHPYDLKVMKLTTSGQVKNSEGQLVPASGLFLYWFVADGQLTPYHPQRMWWMARDLITTGKLQRWAYVAYLSICRPGQEDALLEQMKTFVAETVPDFQLTTGERDRAEAPLDWRFAKLPPFAVWNELASVNPALR